MSISPRRSLGGSVVESSLNAVGWTPVPGSGVSLVETTLSARELHHVVAQNAWNFVDSMTVRELVRPYPLLFRARVRGRRVISKFNVRRASTIVTLTEYMATLVTPVASPVCVVPVTVPLDLTATSNQATGFLPPGTLLVPGSISWYKAPADALSIAQILRNRGLNVNQILFAGTTSDERCWSELQRLSAGMSFNVSRTTLDRSEMASALASSAATVVPSRLESLGFSVAEALALSAKVVVSDIPAHREIAGRIGRPPMWWNRVDITGEETDLCVSLDDGRWREEWENLAEMLRCGPS